MKKRINLILIIFLLSISSLFIKGISVNANGINTKNEIIVEGIEEGKTYKKPNIKFYINAPTTTNIFEVEFKSGKKIEYINEKEKVFDLFICEDGSLAFDKKSSFFSIYDIDSFKKNNNKYQVSKSGKIIEFEVVDSIVKFNNALGEIFPILSTSDVVDSDGIYLENKDNKIYIDEELITDDLTDEIVSFSYKETKKNKISSALLNDISITTNTTIKGELYKNGEYQLKIIDTMGNEKIINFVLDNDPYIKEVTSLLLKGTLKTVKLFVVTLILSIPLGIVGALIKKIKFFPLYNVINVKSDNKVLKVILKKLKKFNPVTFILDIYTWVIRGTPLLLQLFVVYFGIPIIFGSRYALEPFKAASITFVINYTAYFIEIFRGGLESISQGQEDACYVLGMNKVQTFMYVIIPQAFKRVIPSITNEAITLVKDTALANAITYKDLLFYTKEKVSLDFRLEPYFVAAIIYLIFSFVIVIICKKIEKRYSHFN